MPVDYNALDDSPLQSGVAGRCRGKRRPVPARTPLVEAREYLQHEARCSQSRGQSCIGGKDGAANRQEQCR